MASRLAISLLLCAASLAHNAAAQTQGRDCGKAGQGCCCDAAAFEAPRCCATGLQCTRFGSRGFGIPATSQALCLPKEPKACGTEGGRCCLGRNKDGFVSGTCGSGLTCIPGPTVFGSKAQYEKLSRGVAAAAADGSVSGTCRKATTCNTAYNPCGKAAGCGSAACPSGFYCAAYTDSGVGDTCIPLPANAGKVGGPCLPNNLPGAPMVAAKGFASEVSAPFCSGSATCFTPTAWGASAFNFIKGADAKSFATTIIGTKCVEVPADCGTAIGKPCCPSLSSTVTDKALPTAAWGGSVCNPAAGGRYGTYCDGSYAALATDQPLGKCAANIPCGGDGQPCCKYSNTEMAGTSCKNLGGPGAGYCNIAGKCTLCPKIAYSVEDIIRCY